VAGDYDAIARNPTGYRVRVFNIKLTPTLQQRHHLKVMQKIVTRKTGVSSDSCEQTGVSSNSCEQTAVASYSCEHLRVFS
jgi:hypothetical protein